MMVIFIRGIIVTILATLIFASCKKESATQNPLPSQPPPIQNKPPVVYAGTDQDILLPKDSIELIGYGNDADGIIVSYEWTKVSGPSQFSIVSSSTSTTIVKKLFEGRYEFELKVIDNIGFFAKDTVAVIVLDPTKPDPCYGCWDY